MSTRRFERTIDGRPVEVRLALKDLEIGSDLRTAAMSVAAKIGLVGELLGDLTAAWEETDASYRNWRAVKSIEIVGASEKKPAEHVIKDAIESDPEFLQRKTALGEIQGDIEFLRIYHDGLRVKANMLRVLTDMSGKERGATSGATLPSEEVDDPGPSKAADPREAARAARMRERAAGSKKD